MSIRKVNIPKPNGQQEQTNIAPAVEQITDYLPAVGDEVNGYTVGAVVDFIKGLKLGGVVIDIDTDGNIRFNGNIYATGFVSAMGAGTSDGGTASGGGLDESELWRILAGDANSRQILSQYLITALTPYLLTSSLQMLTIKRGGVTIGTYKADTAKSINIELPTFAEVLNKPTTLAGYGITDAMTSTAITTAISNAIATEVTNRNNAISTAIAPVQTTANAAQATADSANSKVDNLQIGGRNLLLNTNSNVRPNIVGLSNKFQANSCSYVYSNNKLTLTNTGDRGFFYYRLGSGSNPSESSWNLSGNCTFSARFTVKSGVVTNLLVFIIEHDGVREIAHRNSISADGTVSVTVNITSNKGMLGLQSSCEKGAVIEVDNLKLELGNKATDWTPAPEDVEEKINNTKTEIINGNVASATKLQTARSLWGNSFNGTKDINNTLIFPTHTDSRHIELNNKYGLCFFAGSGTWTCALNYYKIAGTTVMSYGCHGTNANLLYGYIGKEYNDNIIRFFSDNKVVVGAGTQATSYKPTHTLEVVGTIKGTTAFLGRLMIGYTTEDTNYSIKCDGRFYAGDDSEIYGLLTVDSLVASDNIKGQSLTILGSASITDLSCNIITSNTIKANIGIESNGYVSAMASSASDGRFKTDVQDFNSLSILQRFTFVAYKWRPEAQLISPELYDNTTNYGVIAQDVDGIIDGLVYDAKTQAGTIKAVRYEKLIPIVAKGVQELNDEVAMLRAENAKLRAEIDEIKRQIKRLWNRQF